MRPHALRIAASSAIALELWVATAAGAAGVSVESGAKLALGTGAVAANCADVLVSGTLDMGSGLLDGARAVRVQPGGSLLGGSGTIRAAGPWTNLGDFAAGTGSVKLGDGCGVTDPSIEGTSHFANLELTTNTGKRFAFEAGATQVVSGSLLLSGVPGNLLLIRSTRPGSTAFLNVQGSSTARNVDVDDNDATAGNPIALGSDSIKGPNTPGWLFMPEIPALPLVAAGSLCAALAYLGSHALVRVRARVVRR